MSVVVRFAPSPTGRIHVGNIRTALINWMFAQQNKGRFLLRLDDTDVARSTEEFAHGIREDLTWLGLRWDQEVRQSERFPLYDAAVEKLKASGRSIRPMSPRTSSSSSASGSSRAGSLRSTTAPR